jgi:protein TonB
MNARNETKAGVCSVTIHAAVIALLLLAGATKPIQKLPNQVTHLFAPVELKPFKPAKSGGGGGHGANRAPRRFTPPQAGLQPAAPILAPTITPDVPEFSLASLTIPVVTRAGGGGIGNRNDEGPGKGNRPGNGPGNGPGDGPGEGDIGVGLRIGKGVSAPTLLFSPEPEYSEEARKAKFQGTVRLALIVDEHGNPAQIRIITPLGLGLDQKAIEAVYKWKFKPGTKDGKPVAVQASVEVNFRLL